MRSNDYHWAKINNPMPVNISKDDLDNATEKREDVFGRPVAASLGRKHLEEAFGEQRAEEDHQGSPISLKATPSP